MPITLNLLIDEVPTALVLIVKYGLTDSRRRNEVRDYTQSGMARVVKLGELKEYRKYTVFMTDAQKATLKAWELQNQDVSFELIDHNSDTLDVEFLNEPDPIYISYNRWSCEMEFLEVLNA